MKMSPVVHFEMPSKDQKRIADFYANVFGWKSNPMGPEMGNYVVTQTTETDEKGMIKTPGTINGGFFVRTTADQCPSVVIAVEDIYAAMKNVEMNGGKVLGGQTPGKPDDIPGVGLYCAFLDTEGNRVGILQPKGM